AGSAISAIPASANDKKVLFMRVLLTRRVPFLFWEQYSSRQESGNLPPRPLRKPGWRGSGLSQNQGVLKRLAGIALRPIAANPALAPQSGTTHQFIHFFHLVANGKCRIFEFFGSQ